MFGLMWGWISSFFFFKKKNPYLLTSSAGPCKIFFKFHDSFMSTSKKMECTFAVPGLCQKSQSHTRTHTYTHISLNSNCNVRLFYRGGVKGSYVINVRIKMTNKGPTGSDH